MTEKVRKELKPFINYNNEKKSKTMKITGNVKGGAGFTNMGLGFSNNTNEIGFETNPKSS